MFQTITQFEARVFKNKKLVAGENRSRHGNIGIKFNSNEIRRQNFCS